MWVYFLASSILPSLNLMRLFASLLLKSCKLSGISRLNKCFHFSDQYAETACYLAAPCVCWFLEVNRKKKHNLAKWNWRHFNISELNVTGLTHRNAHPQFVGGGGDNIASSASEKPAKTFFSPSIQYSPVAGKQTHTRYMSHQSFL